jgi:hypothetical protein
MSRSDGSLHLVHTQHTLNKNPPHYTTLHHTTRTLATAHPHLVLLFGSRAAVACAWHFSRAASPGTSAVAVGARSLAVSGNAWCVCVCQWQYIACVCVCMREKESLSETCVHVSALIKYKRTRPHRALSLTHTHKYMCRGTFLCRASAASIRSRRPWISCFLASRCSVYVRMCVCV